MSLVPHEKKKVNASGLRKEWPGFSLSLAYGSDRGCSNGFLWGTFKVPVVCHSFPILICHGCILVNILAAVTKHLWDNMHLRMEVFLLAHSFRVYLRDIWQWTLKVTGCIASVDRKQKGKHCLSSFYSLLDPSLL